MAGKLILSLGVILVIGAMVADQIRCKGMRPYKWGVAGLLTAVLVGQVWLG